METQRSAAVLGVHRLVWLGYKDSGMTGWPQNDDAASFLQADVDEAAGRLATVLREEDADVLTTYDWHGNYGHPDHVKVHSVGHRAAELAQTPAVFEATLNRDEVVRQFVAAREAGVSFGPDDPDFDPHGPADDGNPFGMPEAELTHLVDVSDYMAQKRDSIRCHVSQVSDTGFFLQMPEDVFQRAFGIEWFIKKGGQPPVKPGWLFE